MSTVLAVVISMCASKLPHGLGSTLFVIPILLGHRMQHRRLEELLEQERYLWRCDAGANACSATACDGPSAARNPLGRTVWRNWLDAMPVWRPETIAYVVCFFCGLGPLLRRSGERTSQMDGYRRLSVCLLAVRLLSRSYSNNPFILSGP